MVWKTEVRGGHELSDGNGNWDGEMEVVGKFESERGITPRHAVLSLDGK